MINGTRSWPFENINKIDQPLFKLTTRQRENILFNKIRNDKEDKTTDNEEIENHKDKL